VRNDLIKSSACSCHRRTWAKQKDCSLWNAEDINIASRDKVIVLEQCVCVISRQVTASEIHRVQSTLRICRTFSHKRVTFLRFRWQIFTSTDVFLLQLREKIGGKREKGEERRKAFRSYVDQKYPKINPMTRSCPTRVCTFFDLQTPRKFDAQSS